MKNIFNIKMLQKIIIMILIVSTILSIVTPKNVIATEEDQEETTVEGESSEENTEEKDEEIESVSKYDIFDEDITFERNYVDKNGDIMAHYEFIPSTAKSNESIPLIVWLHGDGGFGSGFKWADGLFHNMIMKSTLKKFNAYILAPHGPIEWHYSSFENREWASSSSGWVLKDARTSLNALIENFVKEKKNVDVNNIIIAGDSRGAMGTTFIASNMEEMTYEFSKAVVVSGFGGGDLSKIKIPTIGYYGELNDDAKPYMKDVFGKRFKSIPLECDHNDATTTAYHLDENHNGCSDMIEWIFDQYEGPGTVIDDYEFKDIEAPGTGLDTITGVLLEPTVKFFGFVVDSIMSILTSFMTETEMEPVMVEIGEVPDIGKPTAKYTISNMRPYEKAGKLNLKYPNFRYSPEEIFAGNIKLFDINFINSSNEDEEWMQIRSVVSKWYQVLRWVAIVGLLCVLIYIGIKIIISSNTKDKAKYKEMIASWFIAVILAFSMHYIMGFILFIVEEVMGLLKGISGVIQVNADKTFTTNLIGLARFQMQQLRFSAKIGHLIIYVALVTFTFKFTIVYLKRVLKMAFLTMISPIVALTYPIDKVNDGKAQGFNMWLKEYIYNALLQPLHYILYYILISSSLTLAAANPIYGIVALGFMTQAEKLLKKIFGFDKAKGGTVGGIAGALATGAITSSLINYIRDPLHPFGGGKNNKGGSKKSGGSQGNTEYDDDLKGINEDWKFENLLGVATIRNNETIEDTIEETSTPTSQNTRETTERPRASIVDDFINKFRLGISSEELGELSFNDGYGDMGSLLQKIYECDKQLMRTDLSPEERSRLQEERFKLNTILKNRLAFNELGFTSNNVPLQYADGDPRTNSQLMEEIMKLWSLRDDTSLPVEQRQFYGNKADKLLKQLNRRMLENQYIQQKGGPQALIEQQNLSYNSSTGYRNTNESSGFAQYTNANTSSESAAYTNANRPGNLINQNINNNMNDASRPNAENIVNNNIQPEPNIIEQKDSIIEENINETSINEQISEIKQKQKQERRRLQPPVRIRINARQLAAANQMQEEPREEEKQNEEITEKSSVIKGVTHVVKTMAKPVWDTEKSDSYNGKRFVGNILRVVGGATVGIAAATVQAGISITDGKYNALEGVAAFGAGMAGVSRLGRGSSKESIRDVYRKAANEGNDEKLVKQYGEQWFNRDDVINNYNREFPGQGKLMRQRALNNYITRGITDSEEQIQAIRYANQLKAEKGINEEEADKIAVATLQYKQSLARNSNYMVLFDKKKRRKYLDTQAEIYTGTASKDSVMKLHDELIENVLDFDRANR